jgi:Protein of unknown function (DUF998)
VALDPAPVEPAPAAPGPVDPAAVVRPPANGGRVLALAGLAGVALAVVLVGALHVIEAETVDPIRRTISQYALGGYKVVFDAGVLALAAGSALVLGGLARAGVVRVPSAGAAFLAVWSVSLVLVIAFEKIDWSVGPTPAGYVHRYASLVAFLSLPAAALVIGRRWRGHAVWGRFAAWSRGLAVLSLLWFAPILLGFVLRPLTGVPWWQFVPLGFTERGLAVSEVAAVVVLGWWAARAAAAGRA